MIPSSFFSVPSVLRSANYFGISLIHLKYEKLENFLTSVFVPHFLPDNGANSFTFIFTCATPRLVGCTNMRKQPAINIFQINPQHLNTCKHILVPGRLLLLLKNTSIKIWGLYFKVTGENNALEYRTRPFLYLGNQKWVSYHYEPILMRFALDNYWAALLYVKISQMIYYITISNLLDWFPLDATTLDLLPKYLFFF